MPGEIIGSIASFGGGLLQGHFNRKQSRENLDRTIGANRELAKYAYAQDMKQLEYMNQYNTPLNQRKRLEEANLNPALMYKSQPQNVQTKMVEFKPPEEKYDTQPIDVATSLQTMAMYNDSRVKTAQSDNLKSQADVNRKETIKKGVEIMHELQKTGKTKVDKEILQAAKKDILRKYSADARKSELEGDNVTKSGEAIELDNAMRELEINLMKKGVYKSDPALLRMLIQNKDFFQKYGNELNRSLQQIEKEKYENRKRRKSEKREKREIWKERSPLIVPY